MAIIEIRISVIIVYTGYPEILIRLTLFVRHRLWAAFWLLRNHLSYPYICFLAQYNPEMSGTKHTFLGACGPCAANINVNKQLSFFKTCWKQLLSFLQNVNKQLTFINTMGHMPFFVNVSQLLGLWLNTKISKLFHSIHLLRGVTWNVDWRVLTPQYVLAGP